MLTVSYALKRISRLAASSPWPPPRACSPCLA